jgi:UDP-2,4-diacetamido-2,4,6-trideoxy-beta-L-altropyranose hydrolase
MVPGISRHDVTILGPGSADDPDALAAVRPEGVELLVVDHYRLDFAFEHGCRSFAHRILVIDDLANRLHDCDLLLDETLGRVTADYKGLVPETCELLLGPHWALLRPDFAEHRARALARRGAMPARVLLLCFGASDPNRLAERLLKAVLDASPDLTCDVVTGEVTEGALSQLARAEPRRARLHGFTNEISDLMTAADLAVGAAGTMSWERCALGLASAVVVAADNQRKIACELEAAGAALLLGDRGDIDPATAAARIAALAADGSRLAAMSSAAAAVCDGEGTRRAVEKIGDVVDEMVRRDSQFQGARPLHHGGRSRRWHHSS